MGNELLTRDLDQPLSPTERKDGMRELAYRVGDGFEVTLLWREQEESQELMVEVDDWRTEEHFEIKARADNALDVFNHPFAYTKGGSVALESAIDT